jgi:hypothetical protein
MEPVFAYLLMGLAFHALQNSHIEVNAKWEIQGRQNFHPSNALVLLK